MTASAAMAASAACNSRLSSACSAVKRWIRSVVASIFYIIVADCFFSVVFYILI